MDRQADKHPQIFLFWIVVSQSQVYPSALPALLQTIKTISLADIGSVDSYITSGNHFLMFLLV